MLGSIVFYATRFVTHCSLGLDCNEQRFSIIEGRCVNPAVPGAIPNWFGAPAYKLLPPTEDLFRAPICDQGKVHCYSVGQFRLFYHFTFPTWNIKLLISIYIDCLFFLTRFRKWVHLNHTSSHFVVRKKPPSPRNATLDISFDLLLRLSTEAKTPSLRKYLPLCSR